MNMSKKIALVTICCGSIGAGLSATIGFYYLAGVFLALMIVLLWLISLTDSPRFASKTLERAGMKLFITWPQNYRYYILIFKAMFNAGFQPMAKLSTSASFAPTAFRQFSTARCGKYLSNLLRLKRSSSIP